MAFQKRRKLRRKFYRKQLLLSRAGGMFKLVYVGKSRRIDTQLQQITPAPSLECLVAVVAALAIAKAKK